MQITYCDLCGLPLKESNYFMLYISEPAKNGEDGLNSMGNMEEYMQRVKRGVKEICPSCKHIFDKMFELRLQRLSELTGELDLIYNLPSKKNLKERKNGKEKK